MFSVKNAVNMILFSMNKLKIFFIKIEYLNGNESLKPMKFGFFYDSSTDIDRRTFI